MKQSREGWQLTRIPSNRKIKGLSTLLSVTGLDITSCRKTIGKVENLPTREATDND